MTSFLSLLLIMLPLKPADFPANMVWMGQGLEPVATIKVKKGHVIGRDLDLDHSL